MPKHIVMVDGASGGHHEIYLRVFVKILLEAEYRVSVFCPAPEELIAWAEKNIQSECPQFEANYFTDWTPPWFWGHLPGRIRYGFMSAARWFHISQTIRSKLKSANKPDLVFFAWLDDYLHGRHSVRLIDWIFPFNWSGLHFHPRSYRSQKIQDASTKGRFLMAPEELITHSRYSRGVAILDAGISSLLNSELQGKKVFVFPDFTDEIQYSDDYPLAEKIKENSKGRKIIGLLGGLSRRKGLLTLMEIARQPIAMNYYFVFAGRLVEQTFSQRELVEVRKFFDAPASNCFVYADKIERDAQFNSLVNVCDVIFAMYQDFPHSSNLVTKAASYGKSLLVSAGGYMEEVVKQYDLGEAVPENDIQGGIVALGQLTTDEALQSRTEGAHAYTSSQSQMVLRKVLSDLVQHCTDSANR